MSEGYADTGFIVSLYLEETTTARAERAIAEHTEPLPILPLTELEFRNALNLAIVRKRIDQAERDAVWEQFLEHVEGGTFVEAALPATRLHAKPGNSAAATRRRWAPEASTCCMSRQPSCSTPESSIVR